jgi:apolipoprotein N-acyltransferase
MRLAGRLGDALALLAGLALPLAFSPFDGFPVAPLSVAVLFLVWLHASPRRACLRGGLFGVAAFGFGLFWVHESFQYNHIALGYAVVLTGVLVLFLALYPACTGYLARRALQGHERWMLLGVLPAVWVLLEWVRGWLFTGVTWLQLGYSQVASPLKGLFPVVGVLGVGWVVCVSAGLLVLAAREPGVSRWRWLALFVALWSAGWLAGLVHWSTPRGEPIRVALVQGNLPQDQKWLAEMRKPTLDRYLSLTRGHWDADLVVWPEAALPGLRDSMDAFVDALTAEARANGAEVIFGVPVLDRPKDRFFNSVFVVGREETSYHKRHLVPFGEYLPLDALLRPITEALGIPVADFSPGPAEQALPSAAGHPLGVTVCYEIAFGREVLRALPQAELLVTVSNDAWFGKSIGPHQHMQMARARALETGRFLLRATNTGITAIVAPDGRIVAQAPQFEIHVLGGSAQAMVGTTPYVRTGNGAVVILASLTLVGMLAGLRRRSPSVG